jgi:signal transduction histidine kinase
MNSYTDDQWADFLDRLVHDLREPLRAINAYTQMLTEVGVERTGCENERALKEILAGSSRMQTLIQSLSGYSLALHENPDSNSGSLQLAFNIAVQTMADKIRVSGATITATSLPKVAVRLERLVQLLENLIENALRFHGEGHPVIKVTSREEPGDQWEIQVEDNGVGVSPQDREAVFQPFMRVEGKKHPGAGLGLTICRRIVESHGGRIRMDPAPGRGSICTFTLPAA